MACGGACAPDDEHEFESRRDRPLVRQGCAWLSCAGAAVERRDERRRVRLPALLCFVLRYLASVQLPPLNARKLVPQSSRLFANSVQTIGGEFGPPSRNRVRR